MKAELSTHRHGSTLHFRVGDGLADANRVADAVKRRWRRGEAPDVSGVLVEHPELQCYRSVVLDLAYTEYRLRQAAGEPIGAETFAQRFPSLQKSLYLLIEVHGLLSQNPELRVLQEGMAWPEAGSRFLQFNLVAEIGRGAFGRVFLATEPAIGDRQIVVKIAPGGGGEAGILGRLRHPSIVPIYSYKEDEASGLAAVCMPYLGRATLCDVLDQMLIDGCLPLKGQAILDAIAASNSDFDSQQPASPAMQLRKGSYVNGVIYLARQLADALAHAHGRGICHRDLKPSNVLITSDGRPLLLDFNLSVDAALPAWKVGGTLPYMPPEELANLVRKNAQSGPLHYDPRSDLFSLGVIVYELLTGKLPFGEIPREDSLDDVACRLREQQARGPRPIRELNRQVDRRLARLIESCLAFETENRPETARQLTASLDRELSMTRRSQRWSNNHPRLTFGMIAAVLALTLAVAAFFVFRAPYSVRQYEVGLTRLEQGQFSQAIDYLNNSIRCDPHYSDALFARGRAYQRLGDYQAAFRDYDAANLLAPRPILIAGKGYCSSRLKSHKDALALYDLALKAGYDRPALLYNNIGFACLMVGKVDDAETNFQRALQLEGDLASAYYGMLQVLLCGAVQGHPLPDNTFVYASKAVETGPPTADLYHAVAALYAVAARQDPKLTEKAVEYVGKSVELGFGTKAFSGGARFAALQGEPSFRDALKTPVRFQSPKPVQLMDPIGEP
jgi:eukaryotic-like serine/threonine-protein kinase